MRRVFAAGIMCCVKARARLQQIGANANAAGAYASVARQSGARRAAQRVPQVCAVGVHVIRRLLILAPTNGGAFSSGERNGRVFAVQGTVA